ncbi:uncharacterized protein LOC119873198 [Canis lupus familiaris]|uniref:uncharacterized protein LOC119873198 n=1 Tax=Canis lupus familiaris TaxID=9615 RepID=UPI0018F7D21A|nr:uncharacterized protein LOC119873198 [Canis lupus familiaris]
METTFSRGDSDPPHRCLGGWLKALMKGGGGHDAARALARVPKPPAVGREAGLSPGPVCCCRWPEGWALRAAPDTRTSPQPGACGGRPLSGRALSTRSARRKWPPPFDARPGEASDPQEPTPAKATFPLPSLPQLGERGLEELPKPRRPAASCWALGAGASRARCAGMVEATRVLSGRENRRGAVTSTLITEELKIPVDRTLTPK